MLEGWKVEAPQPFEIQFRRQFPDQPPNGAPDRGGGSPQTAPSSNQYTQRVCYVVNLSNTQDRC